MILPNGKVVDILSQVLDEINKWLQDECTKPESGGYIVGYQHKKTGNISLEKVSHPYFLDVKNRIRFDIRDPRHKVFLKKEHRRKSYYMGVWHTHPQRVPEPSSIDWDDWNATMCSDKTGCRYVFFIISGTDEWKLWIGDLQTKDIHEAQESIKDAEGIYIKKGVLEDEKNI
jgi:integrative and conjugative element protein (TIGR02256 family)